jgi:hypothetical protein
MKFSKTVNWSSGCQLGRITNTMAINWSALWERHSPISQSIDKAGTEGSRANNRMVLIKSMTAAAILCRVTRLACRVCELRTETVGRYRLKNKV